MKAGAADAAVAATVDDGFTNDDISASKRSISDSIVCHGSPIMNDDGGDATSRGCNSGNANFRKSLVYAQFRFWLFDFTWLIN